MGRRYYVPAYAVRGIRFRVVGMRCVVCVTAHRKALDIFVIMCYDSNVFGGVLRCHK